MKNLQLKELKGSRNSRRNNAEKRKTLKEYKEAEKIKLGDMVYIRTS